MPAPGDVADTAAAWIARLSEDLGVPAMDHVVQAAVLSVAREVAHGTERKYAPLAAFVAGRHVEARARDGAPPGAAMAEVSEAVNRLLGPPRATP